MTALPAPPLLVFTDRRQARRPLVEVAARAFAGGARWLALREKDLPPDDLAAMTQALKPIAETYGVRLALAGSAADAFTCGLDAVHLPRDGDPKAARDLLGETALIGLSAHDPAEAERAAAAGADYVTLSPVFESPSKPGYGPPLGLDGLRAVARGLPIPVLALGGVTAERVAALCEAGAAGVAVMGAVMAAAEPARATAEIIDRIAGQGAPQRPDWDGSRQAQGAPMSDKQ